MKILRKSIFAGAVLLLMFFVRCQEDENNPIMFDMDDLVGEWRLTEFTISVNKEITDAFDTLRNCKKDDIYSYTKENANTYFLYYFEGELKCSIDDPDLFMAGSCGFLSSIFKLDATLMTSHGAKLIAGEKFNVIELNATTFKTEKDVWTNEGDLQKHWKTYTRQ